jgi:SAM-dependent methyltransferase
MTVLAADEKNPAQVLEEAGDQYRQLLQTARGVAEQIVRTPASGLSGAPQYIHRASQELLNAPFEDGAQSVPAEGAPFELFARLAAAWPDLAAGRIEGERVLNLDPLDRTRNLWRRAMMDWPMGEFAQMTARVLIEGDLLGGHVMELGAGVGSCSALVADHVTDRFIRTDLEPFLLRRLKLPGTVESYNFNEPGRWRELDTIFAVNALHCARDKVATLRHLLEMLRTGGVLVIGEGSPHTDDKGTPWALNQCFGMFRGWWDVGGYFARESWIEALRTAGFGDIGFAARRAGAHDLGGVIWAVK